MSEVGIVPIRQYSCSRTRFRKEILRPKLYSLFSFCIFPDPGPCSNSITSKTVDKDNALRSFSISIFEGREIEEYILDFSVLRVHKGFSKSVLGVCHLGVVVKESDWNMLGHSDRIAKHLF